MSSPQATVKVAPSVRPNPSGFADSQGAKPPLATLKLDRSAKVLESTAVNSELLSSWPRQLRGKHFFKEVATCAQTAEFEGVFQAAMAGSGFINHTLTHRFASTGTPPGSSAGLTGRVHVFSSVDAKGQPCVWLTVRELDAQAIARLGQTPNARSAGASLPLKPPAGALAQAPAKPQSVTASRLAAPQPILQAPRSPDIFRGFDN
jgi:hypothetical protein